ncbi:LysR substrate-binding domain-containing protein [Alishewanella sp. SMS9]|nr:LysR substrate-binding domain-containing protein [Alishewanella sp. SMS9]
MIAIRKLQVFSCIARLGNLSSAASELYLSKAAVSQALNELEAQLGAPLFDRVHPRLKLNEQGRLLQPLADEILARVSDIEHLFQQNTPQGQLSLGASQTIGNYLLPRLLSQLAPGQFKVSIDNTYTLCQQVLQFELDLALIEGDNPFPDLITQPWRQDEKSIIAKADHPLAGTTVHHYHALQQQSWVLREAHSGSRAQFDRHLAPHLPTITAITEFNSPEAIMQAVEAGLGLSFISAAAAADRLHYGRLAKITLPTPFTRQLQLVWHKQKYHSVLARQFIALCQP